MAEVVDLRFKTVRAKVSHVQEDIAQIMQDSKLLFGPEAQQVIAQEADTCEDKDDARN